jgi:hypothetical protein
MYESACDEDSVSVVGVYSAAEQTDADYEHALRDSCEMDLIATERGLTFIHAVVVDADVGAPPAVWRKRFAETTEHMQAPSYIFAFITPSPLHRGVFTAVSWLGRTRPSYSLVAYKNFDAAAAAIRERAGEPYPRLEGLYNRARKALMERTLVNLSGRANVR